MTQRDRDSLVSSTTTGLVGLIAASALATAGLTKGIMDQTQGNEYTPNTHSIERSVTLDRQRDIPIGSHLFKVDRNGNIAVNTSQGNKKVSMEQFAPALVGYNSENECPSWVDFENRESFLHKYEGFTGKDVASYKTQLETFRDYCRDK